MRKSYRKASAIILACIIIVVLVILGGALLSRSISENTISQKYLLNAKSFWAAEAAIAAAKYQLEQSWYNRAASESVFFDQGTYNFTIYTTDTSGNPLPATQLRVVAQGVVSGVTRTLEAIFEHVIAQIFRYAVVGVVKVELKSGATVHGDVYVNGNAEVKAGASVVKIDDSVSPVDTNAYNADVYYTGSSANILGTVEGDVIHTTTSIAMPTFDWEDIKSNANYVLPAGTTLNGHIANGVYYITGDVQLNNVTIDQGSIVAEGKIEVNNNFSNNEPVYGIPVLGALGGTIEINGTAFVRGLVYSQSEGIELKTGSVMNVYGAIVGASSDVELKTDLGTLNLYYKSQYLTELPNHQVEILSWQEQQNPYTLQ